MTYRAKASGRAERRRKHKELELEQRVTAAARNWLLKHPPQIFPPVENLSVSARMQTRDNEYGRLHIVEFSQTKRPEAALWEVPVLPRVSAAVINESAYVWRYNRILMRPVKMSVQYDGTRLRWWNWEPVHGTWDQPVEAEIYGAARKAVAYMTRVCPIVEHLAEMDPYGHRDGFPGEVLRVWWSELIEAFEVWMGKTRTRYEIPVLNRPTETEVRIR